MAPRGAGVLKEKRRNSEKRKEKSRDAARCRRGRESEIFLELTKELPIPNCNQLDKATIMRLTIGYVKMRHLVDQMQIVQESLTARDLFMDQLLLKALEGFLFILSSDGEIVYLTENVNRFIGLTQIDLIGHSIYDFSHPCDHEEIKEMLSFKGEVDDGVSRSFFIRMKSTLTDKGKNVNMKSANYKVIHCSGRVICDDVKKEEKSNKTFIPSLGHCLITVGEPIGHPSDIDVPLDKQTFLSRHELDMSFSYVDERMSELLGYSSEDLLGKKLFHFHHAQDSEAVDKFYKVLFSKGQSETGCYRFLAKEGGYVWILTQATIIYGGKAQKPHCIVCINYILSGLENVNEIVSLEQVNNKDPAVETLATAPYNQDNIEVSSPLPCTNTIFTPRTKDMNKGFLTFLDDESGYTVLKDEPEDLTHLAPTAGDVCIPLDVPSFSNEMFEDVFFTDSLESMMITDFTSIVEDIPSTETPVPLTNDPLLSYRADRMSLSDSDDMPSLSKIGNVNSADVSSSASSPATDIDKITDFASPCENVNFLGYKLETTNILSDKSPSVDLEGDEFDLRAPYIPMGIGEDLPLLTSPDHSWNQSTESNPAKMKCLDQFSNEIPTIENSKTNKSSLAELLQSSLPLKMENQRNCNFPLIIQDGILERDKKTFCGMDSNFRSEFDGGGMRISSDLAKIKFSKDAKNNSSPIANEKKKLPVTIPDIVNCNLETDPQCEGGTDSSRLPTPCPQKRNRDLTSGGRSQSKRAKVQSTGDETKSTDETKDDGNKNKNKESVLMNLLNTIKRLDESLRSKLNKGVQMSDSICTSSLLNPEGTTIPTLLDITQLDMEVNAPIHNYHHLLQGQDLLNALDATIVPEESFI